MAIHEHKIAKRAFEHAKELREKGYEAHVYLAKDGKIFVYSYRK